MTSKEALNDIKQWIEYITRLDYVEPEVRNEVKKLLYDAYHKTTPEFKIIEQDLEVLKILKELFSNNDYLTIMLKLNYLYKIKDETDCNLVKEWLENVK